jgi:hypothetical protein
VTGNFGWEFSFQQGILRWTGSTVRGPGGVARVHRGPMWHGQEGAARPAGGWSAGARAHRCSPVIVEEDEPDEAVAKRQRNRGKEQRQLEPITRVKEGAKELGREGKRGGEGRGLS